MASRTQKTEQPQAAEETMVQVTITVPKSFESKAQIVFNQGLENRKYRQGYQRRRNARMKLAKKILDDNPELEAELLAEVDDDDDITS